MRRTLTAPGLLIVASDRARSSRERQRQRGDMQRQRPRASFARFFARNGEAPPSAERRGFSVASRKPDPVVGGHPSRPSIAGRLVRPVPGNFGRATLERSPIWPCTGRGLPSRPVARTAGELLPHRFTLARTSEEAVGGLLSVALSLGFPRLDVIQRPALRCPDFPRRGASRAVNRRATRPHRGHLACRASIPRCRAFDLGSDRRIRGGGRAERRYGRRQARPSCARRASAASGPQLPAS
jgi:hypothetical protein